MTAAKRYYPIFMDIENQPCLVVGGGDVAEQKVTGLIAAGAVVTVESPELTANLQALAQAEFIRHKKQDYHPATMTGMKLVIAATNDEAINEKIFHDASASNIPVNVVDDPKRCSFIVPSIVRQGALQIAISTAGISPALSKKIRRELEEKFDESYGAFLELLAEFRPLVTQSIKDFETKKALWEQVLASDVFDLVKRGDIEKARARLKDLLAVTA